MLMVMTMLMGVAKIKLNIITNKMIRKTLQQLLSSTMSRRVKTYREKEGMVFLITKKKTDKIATVIIETVCRAIKSLRNSLRIY